MDSHLVYFKNTLLLNKLSLLSMYRPNLFDADSWSGPQFPILLLFLWENRIAYFQGIVVERGELLHNYSE